MILRRFFLITFLLLLVLPLINISNGITDVKKISELKKLYSTDVVEGYFNRFLLYTGISSSPGSTLIGDNGWLFLGDNYDNTITGYRNGIKSNIIEKRSHNIVGSQLVWNDFFKMNGVKDFKIIIGPNKSTIYSERFPDWAKTPNASVSSLLYENNEIYLDSINNLIESKKENFLYYHSDTHWNSFGAGVAFYNFIDSLKNKNNIIMPPETWGKVIGTSYGSGGDLAAFLKVQNFITDVSVHTGIEQNSIQHTIYDFDSKKKVYEGSSALYGSMLDRYLIETPDALNDSKVLWLSDSFGNALAPYITATFSKVLKQHWHNLVGTKELENLVMEWKPDYVVYTVVERKSLSDAFLKIPSLQVSNNIQMTNVTFLKAPILNSLSIQGEGRVSVVGNDPFLLYSIDSIESVNELLYLNFELSCENKINDVPVQIFWKTKDSKFNESDSMRFIANDGKNQIPLYGLLGANNLNSLRFDLDGNVECREFTLKNVALGQRYK